MLKIEQIEKMQPSFFVKVRYIIFLVIHKTSERFVKQN